MSTNINFKKHLGAGSAGSGISLPSASAAFENTKSIDLDGVDDHVDCGNPSNLNFSADDAFSISIWFKKGSQAGYGGSLVRKQISISPYTGYILFVYDDKVNFRIRQDGSHQHRIIDNNTHPINTWVHYVATYDGSRTGSGLGLKLYKNGALLTNVTRSGNFFSGSGQTSSVFGIGGDDVSGYIPANIDEVAVFNSELSASNVTSIYNSGAPNDISSLSPLSWWRCGDGDTSPTLTDNGSGGNDGTMTNFSTFSTDVPIELFSRKSIDLDGVDDYVTMGDISDIENINTLSIGFWFKYNSITTSADGLISKDDSTRVNGNWYIALQSNQVRFLLKTANGQDALNSTTLSSGTWYHTLCVWDGSNMKIYINGTLNNSISVTNATGTLGSTNDSVRIGRRINDRLDGFIDEVAIWTNDQSSNVATIYNSGNPADLTSLSPISWWRFEEGSGTTATDSGTGGNNGTLTGGPTYSTDVPS